MRLRTILLLLVGLFITFSIADNTEIEASPAVQGDPCVSPANEIVAENCLTGNPPSQWDVSGAGDLSIQGFATEISVNQGETVSFKVKTDASDYRLDIYRLGYYDGNGARLITSVEPTAILPQSQPTCLYDALTGLVDCGNWAVSAQWTVPTNATSGIYIAKLEREDVASQGSHIVFIVRDDDGNANLLFQTADTTWQAYNRYGDIHGDRSLYVGAPDTVRPRAYKVSYNRPFTTRAYAPEDWLFNAEYPMVRWLERNGYDVSYTTGVDSDRSGAELLEHEVFLSVGHDEYWSSQQRDNVEAARAAGVNLAFFSSNEIFWKTRWENSIDSSNTPYRTLVSYKETHNGAKIDPEPAIWTGTWRDPRPFNPEGPQPENSLTGQIFTVNCCQYAITVPAEFRNLRFWRNTSITGLTPEQVVTLTDGSLGYEWDENLDNEYRPSNLIRLSRTTVNVPEYIQDFGSNYGPGTATHHLIMYRHSSGAIVFGSGTLQWSWGLDAVHDRTGGPADARIQQATVNLFADMGVQPATLQSGLTPAIASTDTTPPTASITTPTDGATVQIGVPVAITGTASDTDGVVGAVEVSVDGGTSWRLANGMENWSFSWTPTTEGPATILARAIDDSLNQGASSAGVNVTVAPRTCPCTVWEGTPLVGIQSGDAQAVELGFKFRSSQAGYITALRFYKYAINSGVHVGRLWTSTGTLLAEVTFTNETASGWQEQALTIPIAIDPNTTYIATYHTPTGHYAFSNGYFSTSGVDASPLRALANGEDGPNGVYRYGSGGGFPTDTFNASHYWVDVVFDDDIGPDTTPPVVTQVAPANGASGVPVTATVNATFNEPIDAATLTNNFTVVDGSNAPVLGVISYNAVSRTATFTPAASLANSTTYTATLVGGASGIKDPAGNALATNFIWSFTTAAPPPPPPDEGPGGPILVIASAANPFGRYYAEILRTEGLNAFTVTDISAVDATVLAGYDVVILAEMPLSAAQVSLLTDWVNAGGKLIAMRPDKQLAGLLGLTDAGSTLSEAYLLVDTASGPGQGIVNQTIQYHSAADLYTLNGSTPLATIYSTASNATQYPAVTLRNVGSNGGQAAAFTFDLARSIVYTRQGNPAWVGQERDGFAPLRSSDLFFPDWIDLSKVAIPQADEQQRLLANMITEMNLATLPLPRFWYFPRGEKAVVVLTGDDHGNANIAARLANYDLASPSGCSVEDWECVRSTAYLYPNSQLSPTDALFYHNKGFEIGIHVNTGCANWTPASLANDFSSQIAAWQVQFPTVPPPITHRTHCIAWSDWVTAAKVELQNGMRLDTNYYYWPPAWVNDTPGLFTGSGMAMRFADLDGTMVDVYQATTQMTDESGQSYPFTIDTLLDRALGPEGYYGAFVTNMHHDSGATLAQADAIIASAQSRNVPIVSSVQLLTWLDGRGASSFENLNWSGNTLTFEIQVGVGANGLQAMVPIQSTVGDLTGILFNGSPVVYTTQTVKGVEYAFFNAQTGAYSATYAVDTTPPVISNVSATTGTSANATVTWDTNEAATSQVNYGVAPGSLDQSVSNGTLVTSHSLNITGLLPGTTYYYRVTSTDGAANTTTSPVITDPPLQFTTPSAAWVDSTTADFSAGTEGICSIISIGDGAVTLGPTAGSDFDGNVLPADWVSDAWTGGASTVSGGLLTVDGARAATQPPYFAAGRALEFQGTFGAATFQHIGFGQLLESEAGESWAMFSTFNTTDRLFARTNDNGTVTNYELPGTWLGTSHRYRIEWTSTSVTFLINGQVIRTEPVAIEANMRPLASDFQLGGATLTLDWLQMSPYTSPCQFESRIFDAGAEVLWDAISWDSTEPTNTAITMTIRTGNTPTPDASWTGFVAVTNGAAIGSTSRYIEYRATLSTTNTTLTPILEAVTVTYHIGGDTVPPSIVNRTPAPNDLDVPLDTNVSVQFSEPMDDATFTGSTLRLRKVGAGSDVPATVSYDGVTLTATLDPTADLDLSSVYTVTLSGAVTDVAGNPLGVNVEWNFTTAGLPPQYLTDTTTADFSAGTVGTCTIAEIGGGTLILSPTVNEEFNTLPTSWESFAWTGGTPSVASGQLNVDGARFATINSFAAGRVIEFVATFRAESFQHVGFGQLLAELSESWAMFSTGGTTTTLFARTNNNGTTVDTAIPGSWLNTPHLYRIEWTPTTVIFSIDGVVVHTQAVTLGANMRPVVSDYQLGGQLLTVDWLRMTPYGSPCTFESQIFDAGAEVNWEEITWESDEASGTSITISVRTGNTATPDGTWSAFTPVTNGGSIGAAAQYAQYRAELATTNVDQTPALESVTLAYTAIPNRAPVLNAIGDQSVAENGTLNVAISATDADLQALTLSATGLPAFATLTDNGDNTATLALTPTFADEGVYPVTISVTDGDLSDDETFTITVTNTNRAPVLNTIGDQSVAENGTLNVAISATDADLQALTFSATGLPAFATLTDNGDNTATLALTPGFTDAGIYPVTISVTDGDLSDDETFTITVTNTNRAPVLAAIGDQSVAENGTLNVAISATDADLQALTLSATGLPAFATLTDNGDNTATLALTPTFADEGAYPVTISVTDGDLSDDETFTITVTNTNRAPVLNAIGDQLVAENGTLNVAISATDADLQALTFSATGLPAFATLTDNGDNTATLALTPTFADEGVYPVTISVTDGDLSDDETFTITVTNTNRAPVLNAIGDQLVAENGTLNVAISATDADLQALTFSATGLPAFATLTDNGDNTATLALTPTFADEGVYPVTISVTDGDLSDDETFTITVTNTNRAPVLGTIGNKTLAEGSTLEVIISASDLDLDLLTYSSSALPSFATLIPGGGVATLRLTPGSLDAGTYNVTFTVSDGDLSDSEAITITVTDVPGSGLRGEYYDNLDFTALTLTRVDATVNFSWGSGSPASGISPDTFSVRWTGQVEPQFTQTYTFFTQTDDGARLWVNNVLLIDDWQDQGTTENSGTIALTGGQRYTIRYEYYDRGGGATARLLWSSLSQPKQIIPTSRLFPLSGPTVDAGPDQVVNAGGGGTATVIVSGNATDPDGTIVNTVWSQSGVPFAFTPTASVTLPIGTHILTLTATDNDGLVGADTVSITVSGVSQAGGLTGEYFDNLDFTNSVLTRIDPTMNFSWGSGSPASGISPDTFSVRWTGQVEPQFTQTYTFFTQTDDGARLWVNNVLLIDDWQDQGTTENSGTIALTGGQRYTIRYEYYDRGGGATARLLWSSLSQPKQIIPANRLYPFGAPVVNAGPDQTVTAGGGGTATVNVSGTATDTDGVVISTIWTRNGIQFANTLNAAVTLPVGVHTLVLTATDNDGLTGVDSVVITVAGGSQAGGLRGEYFNNRDFTAPVLQRIDPTVFFSWGTGSPDPAIGPDTFSVRWTGQVEPLFSETYTFYTQSDDGVRLWVNNQLLIDNWTDHGTTENSGQIALQAGQRYDIRLEYYENGGGATIRLLWSSVSVTKQLIVSQRLYPPTAP